MTYLSKIKESLHKRLTELENKSIIAGVLIECESTGRVLLLLRNDKIPLWALMTGTIDEGENVIDGLKREIHEELLINANIITFKKIRVEQIPEKNREFHFFKGFTTTEFKPILDHENLNYGWFSKDKLPSPLYKGVAEKIAEQ